MGTLLLRLAAPLQSWGTNSKFEIRKTGREPSKSGVIGLLAAAMGIGREEPERLVPLNRLRFGVRVDQEGTLLIDYHIARKEENKRGNGVKVTSYETKRHYLADAIFLVGLESEDSTFLKRLEEALYHPAFSLFLGRRSCPPTLPLCLGIRETDLEAALRGEPLLTPSWRKTDSGVKRMLLDAYPEESGAVPQRDLSVSFSQTHRQFAYRAVKESKMINLPSTEHNAFSEL